MCACARALAQRTEKETRDLEECASRAITLRILQKEKKVVFTAATHRSISRRPFLEISKRIFDSRRVDLQIFHERKHALEHIKRAPLFFYASARALERRERETVSSSFSSSKERRERERERDLLSFSVFQSAPEEKIFR